MTQLEAVLSNLMHCPMKLIDINIPAYAASSHADRPVFRLTMDVTPDLHHDYEDKYVPDDDIPFCGDDCDHCNLCEEDEEDEEPVMWGIPDVDRVIFNDPATIVFWADGTKTVVKAMEGDRYEKYAGFAMACMKKMFGSTSRAKAVMDECAPDTESKPKSNPKKTAANPKVPELSEFIRQAVINTMAQEIADAIGRKAEEKADDK